MDRKARARARYQDIKQNNPEQYAKMLNYSREYYHKNKEKIREKYREMSALYNMFHREAEPEIVDIDGVTDFEIGISPL